MRVIHARNVHQALPEACRLFQKHGVKRSSRNGEVLVLDEPLTTVFQKPRERVLFWPERDANPFFHLMEAFWMMDGRRDVAFLETFNSHIASYSDDGDTFNAAYGWRWLHHFEVDQPELIAKRLKENPDCRRQVLSMWDGYQDLTQQNTKDLPCNTQAYFQRNSEGALDMMVTNRSNDLIWGAYGANAVHFSYLQEFIATRIGCPVGRYWQTSMNTHVYLDKHGVLLDSLAQHATMRPACPYSRGEVEPFDYNSFTTWAQLVVHPVRQAWGMRHEELPMAKQQLLKCSATDWALACNEWLERRNG